MIQTLHFKVRNPSKGWLDQGRRETNRIWNFINETSHKAIRYYAHKPLNKAGWHQRYLTAMDVNLLFSGGIAYDVHTNPDGLKSHDPLGQQPGLA